MMRTFHLRILSLLLLSCNLAFMSAQQVSIQTSELVGQGIARFVPSGFDSTKAPELMLKKSFPSLGALPTSWTLIPTFTQKDGKACASLNVVQGTSLYGGGEVTGPLLRNGQAIKLWNSDTPGYSVDNGKRLYQTHPWVLGVRADGTAFGILFESIWKSELITNSDQIQFNTQGAPFRIYVIDRKSPQEVVKGLAELTGTIDMPPLWALGYQQCRWSYESETRVKQIADTFRLKKIPCDVIWMDIDYMDGFRIFTFDKNRFPNPMGLNTYLHQHGFHSVFMIDPGVKFDSTYSVYKSGAAQDVFVKDAYNKEYHGKVWPGLCAYPDFTQPKTRAWWASQYKDFMALGIDGVWNDMNEPSVFDVPSKTMPETNIHLGGGNLPTGTHLMYHNTYGRLMVEASHDGITAANPNKRPFLLTRSNLIGGQRYAATWTGDNVASEDHMKLSIPMTITLGLSGQPFNGPDIGGFMDNTDGALWSDWLSAGIFFPFTRGHACKGTNNKEPWAFGKQVEASSRIAITRRYRLLPFLYTLFYQSHLTGLPVMNPVFFSDPADPKLRAEQQVFLLGDDLLVIPPWAKNPALPKGIWEKLNLVKGDDGKKQATLKVKGGSIIPLGKEIQSTQENSLDPLTLVVCLDAKGNANGSLFWDSGDGWNYPSSNRKSDNPNDYKYLHFTAHKAGNTVQVSVSKQEGARDLQLKTIRVQVLEQGKKHQGSGTLEQGITIKM